MAIFHQLAFGSSGRNKVWNFTSSVFMTVGVADTLWHPQFFSDFPLEFRV